MGYFGTCDERSSRIAEPCSDIAPFRYSGFSAENDRGKGYSIASVGMYGI